jgi:hypothetical protein
MAKIIHSTRTSDGVAAPTQTSKPGTGRGGK